MKGAVIEAFIPISYNINGVISDADGERWRILKVTDKLGNDLSGDAAYNHWVCNVQFFEKAGFYASDEGNTANPMETEGSWWGEGISYLNILLNGTDVHQYRITQLAENSFVSTYYDANFEEISLHYVRLE